MGVLKSTERSRVGGGVVVQPAWGWVAEGAASAPDWLVTAGSASKKTHARLCSRGRRRR